MRVAHLSDVHLLENGPGVGTAYSLSTRIVSYARSLTPLKRAANLRRALAEAVRLEASHVVISGDLTEIGSDAQFATLARALHDSGITPDRITLVPGNHDAYTTPDGWKRALDGPLAAFRASSAAEPGQVVDRGEVVFLPIDSTCYQSIARSGGELTEETAIALERRLVDTAFQQRPLVLVQHHPPFPHRSGAWNWIDGLRGSARLIEMLLKHTHAQLLHGHLHRIADRVLGTSRVFGASAVVDDDERPRVRVYDVRGGVLESVGFDPLAA
jgi:3',5'-cyclic AMP phosphodiesterase CpdA